MLTDDSVKYCDWVGLMEKVRFKANPESRLASV